MAVVASLFGDLAKGQNLQALIDNQIQLLYGGSIWRQYLDWGIPQIELTFATAIGRSRIEAAASIVDPDAPAPLRSSNKLEKLEGKIPTMKEKFAMNQDDYRKLRSLQTLPISDEQRLNLLIGMLWNAVENASTSTDKRIDIMFLQGISTFEVNVGILNNPDGVNFGTVSLLAAPDQKRTVGKVWTDPTADPFQDIDDVVTYAAGKGRTFSEIWIDRETWLSMKKLAAVKADISAMYNPGSNLTYKVTLSSVNEYLVENQLPTIRIVNERRGIEKDGKIETINPFKKENVVFLPSGKLGIVHNAVAIEGWEPVNGVNYANYDRTIVSQWRDNDPWKEYTQAELSAFPALEQIDGIYILQTDVATA
ncbi:major capsid protein [Parapedobacter indicus]|uniref:Phage major capsid protein E n=1 Tax=Parapedobacter indicus TaxID=1477437 RepID=A0A1I3V408_9SPHI|nr:major capsid protein [Parapedobacter indicus]PPK98980.1 major capsid protein E [Parapedobacter indicus]SFJ89683.1 Phage major capsid protein E [Parapedobacter indicus]